MLDKMSAIVTSFVFLILGFYVFSGFVGSLGFWKCLFGGLEACLWSSVKQAEKERHQGAKV